MNNFSSTLAEIIRAKGITDREAAELAGVHHTFLSAILNNRTKGMTFKSLAKLLKISTKSSDQLALLKAVLKDLC